ncbi:DNA-binding protein [Dactylosporangium salmoneum]|uniref:DNA-binding protein n=1 Tax=Dactylosporangium salmoneum TaxID=53361 RepID=A0ABP5T6R7_9ACTN
MLLTMEEVMGAHEIGQMLGVSRQRVQQITARPDFPAPAWTLAMGKAWLAVDVRAWVREHRTDLAEHPEAAPRRRPVKRTPRKAGPPPAE